VLFPPVCRHPGGCAFAVLHFTQFDTPPAIMGGKNLSRRKREAEAARQLEALVGGFDDIAARVDALIEFSAGSSEELPGLEDTARRMEGALGIFRRRLDSLDLEKIDPAQIPGFIGEFLPFLDVLRKEVEEAEKDFKFSPSPVAGLVRVIEKEPAPFIISPARVGKGGRLARVGGAGKGARKVSSNPGNSPRHLHPSAPKSSGSSAV